MLLSFWNAIPVISAYHFELYGVFTFFKKRHCWGQHPTVVSLFIPDLVFKLDRNKVMAKCRVNEECSFAPCQ